MKLPIRIARLESTHRPYKLLHRVIRYEGQSLDAALDAYGCERVGAHDGVIVRHVLPAMPAGSLR